VPSIAPFRILVVDESDAFLASVVEWIASRRDLRLVGTARGGYEVLNAVERLSPDLVILDAVLSGIDGFRLTRSIKKRAEAPLVVLLTFHASAAAREEALVAGADGFLAKQDFTDGFEALLAGWAEAGVGRTSRPTIPERPVRRGSRTEPDR